MRKSFGFESRIGQASYPILISIMLLTQHYVFPTNPGLKSAEFLLSVVMIGVYILCRKFACHPRYDRYRPQIDFAEKIIEVYIGVTVIASLLYIMIVSAFG